MLEQIIITASIGALVAVIGSVLSGMLRDKILLEKLDGRITVSEARRATELAVLASGVEAKIHDVRADVRVLAEDHKNTRGRVARLERLTFKLPPIDGEEVTR